MRQAYLIWILMVASVLLYGCKPIPPPPGMELPTTESAIVDSPPVASTEEAVQGLPFAWPMPAFTEEQIEAARACDIENLVIERYPMTLAQEELLDSYAPQDACDWALLATAHAFRQVQGEPLLPEAEEAFTNALLGNPALMFTTYFFYGYFDALPLVESPDFVQQEITDVRIEYYWAGMSMGGAIEYVVEIAQADGEPVVTSTALTETVALDASMVQTFTNAFGSFLPVNSKFELTPCTDNYPSWVAQLTFADGTEVELSTDSNFMFVGGPWFMETDGQLYLQMSSAFGVAIATLVDSLGLPLGEAAATTCYPAPPFDLAFPAAQ